MIGDWTKLPAQSGLPAELLELESILAEYNGPQIAIFRFLSGRYLGVAADEEKEIVRWLLAPLSSVELQALAVAAMPTRELFVKDERIIVVDADDRFTVTRIWTDVDGATLGDNLPEAEALLPRETRHFLRAKLGLPDAPELSICSTVDSKSGLGFRALSEVLGVFQRFANAYAQATLPDARDKGRHSTETSRRAALSFVSARSGSLRIDIGPQDSGLFRNILSFLKASISAAHSSETLDAILIPVGPRVRARYAELLEVVRTNHVQVLTRDTEASAFISPPIARRVSKNLVSREVVEARHTRPVFGSFVAYDSGGLTFEFESSTGDAIYSGLVLESVANRYSAISVGPGASYIVMITTVERVGVKGDDTYELQDIVRQVESETNPSPA